VARSSQFRELCPIHRGIFAMSGFSDQVAEKSNDSMFNSQKRFQRAVALPLPTIPLLRRTLAHTLSKRSKFS
jgi:hypothetical protein